MSGRIFAFVYGTLKEGYGNSQITDDYRVSVTRGWLYGKVYDLGLFPGLRLKGPEKVYGEIHELRDPEAALQRMDRLEGYREDQPEERNFYNRRKVMVNILDDPEGSQVECFVYEFNRPLEEDPEWEDKREKDGIWDPKNLWGMKELKEMEAGR